MNIINLTDFSKGSFRKQIFYPLNRVKLNDKSFREGVKKKTKKKVVILLQPPSIYLPTPIGVQKATFLIFFQYFEMMF